MASDKSLEKIPPSPDTLCEEDTTETCNEKKEPRKDVDSQSGHSIHGSRSSIARSDHSRTVSDHSQEGVDIDIEDDVLQRTITAKLPLVKVSRSKRRGLFARFALVAEVTEPTSYKNSTKWFITFTVAVAAAAAPIGTSIIFRTLDLAMVFVEGVD